MPAPNPSRVFCRCWRALSAFPYFLLSATGPLLQRWYARRERPAFPYRLFAVSNLGSLAALMLYPFVIEPVISVHHQLAVWSVAYGVVVAAARGRGVAQRAERSTEPAAKTVAAARQADRLLWIALAACPSALWLGVANELSQNVAPIPLLWILPLSIYLLSFILCFDREGWYRTSVYRIALPIGWVLMGVGISRLGSVLPLAGSIARAVRRAVRLLHVLPRRTGAPQAGPAATHIVTT